MEKGIILIALGKSEYIKMAFNLAVSIQSTERTNITLVYSDELINYLSKEQQSIFDNLIICNKDYYQLKGINSFVKSKVHLYELSPYDKTLYIDVDTAWNPYKKPSEVFNELAGIELTFKNTGYYSLTESKSYDHPEYTYWFDVEEMSKAYKVKAENVYQIQSEFFYFERSKTVKRFFDDAIKIYSRPKVESKVLFANQRITDEMAFSISMAINDMKPHLINWLPTYWHLLNKLKVVEDPKLFTEGYYLLSIGGTYVPATIMQLYKNIIKKAFNKFGGIPFTINTKTQQN